MLSWERVPDQTIKLCFHGTPEANIDAICSEGLDPARRAAQAHGPGEYFATNPLISVPYCKGGRKMLVFAVLVDASGLTKDGGSIIVVNKPEHQLPLFVLTLDGGARPAAHALNPLWYRPKRSAIGRRGAAFGAFGWRPGPRGFPVAGLGVGGRPAAAPAAAAASAATPLQRGRIGHRRSAAASVAAAFGGAPPPSGVAAPSTSKGAAAQWRDRSKKRVRGGVRCRPPFERKRQRRRRWTMAEDLALVRGFDRHGHGRWKCAWIPVLETRGFACK